MSNHKTHLPLAKHLAPLVHLNGSDQDDLLGQWSRFRNAITENVPNFHRRDYYVKRNQAETEAAIEQLQQLLRDLVTLIDDVNQRILERKGDDE